ncbi:type II secretion system protein [Idiomarina piscisalsi]|uniref:type II secretion system protein n=1 Tax=Idiomarina piscisalsi TaxID=1096243 RepID=UPI001385812E|nr:type II secretion system protein [Idiomarina piscisalsi]MTJ01683.1 prepilin-type N-terminal cleavage/methylation domain-containing protein [Idiomarina piscisalsi]
MRRSKGFTLVELIIVIVVLGVLSATAAPQFINFSNDAETSRLHGLEASLKSALDMTYGKAAIQGIEKQSATCLGGKFDDVNISCPDGGILLFYGYPAPKESALSQVIQLDDWAVSEVGIGNVIGLAADEDSLMNCYVNYIGATSTSEPEVKVYADNC